MNPTPKRMELDHREADGGESFELTVEDANARDAFEHPFAYAAFRGVLRRESLPIAAWANAAKWPRGDDGRPRRARARNA